MMEMVIYKEGARSIQTSVTNGYCDFTGEYKQGGQTTPDLTVEQYLEKLGKGYSCITYENALKKIRTAEDETYLTPWEEITEDQWFYALEVLPPEKWKTVNGIEFFRMAERMTGNITGHYARIKNKYFKAYRRTTDNYQTLSDEIFTTFKN